MLPTNANNSLAMGNNQSTESFSDILDAYQRNSNWWTVFSCFDLVQFDGTVQWIVKSTNLTAADAEEALEGLRRLGYIRKDGAKYSAIRGKDFVHFNFEEKTRGEAIDQHALVSQQILNELKPTQKFAFDHRCIAANDEIIVELQKDIAAAIEKAFAKASRSSRNDKIFKMTFTAVDVLKPRTGESK